MAITETTPVPPVSRIEELDVLIVGAGLSGIAAAYHVQSTLPHKRYAILEARGAIGGTWDLFRYPGIRSDSDMHTLGYGFRPWTRATALADGPSIRQYVTDTAREYGIDEKIRFHHRVLRADWSSAEQRWNVEVQRTDTGETVQISARFVFGCTGYYRYDEGYKPSLPGAERFRGQIIHPQDWTEDVDYAGKRVLVIGSGATAVTMVPAMAGTAAHVTMLQRSPSYIVSLPNEDPLAKLAHRILPPRLASSAVRWKNILLMMGSYQLSRRWPKFMRKMIRTGVLRALPDYDVDTHFNPAYDPWDQRLCVIPDGDLFRAVQRGQASIVTDRIATFTEHGIVLESGRELEADLVVSATGLNMLLLGGIGLSVDGEKVDPAKRFTYRGMMLSDVPNAALTIGYTNASWTLKCDLICQYIARLLAHMDAHGYTVAIPHPDRPDLPQRPMITLSSGYVKRAEKLLPHQSDHAPWQVHQNYFKDLALIRRGDIEEGMRFLRAGDAPAAAVPGESAESSELVAA